MWSKYFLWAVFKGVIYISVIVKKVKIIFYIKNSPMTESKTSILRIQYLLRFWVWNIIIPNMIYFITLGEWELLLISEIRAIAFYIVVDWQWLKSQL